MPDRPCANVPHPFVSVYVYHCAHQGDHVALLAYGEASDEAATSREVRFGPFDTRQDLLDVVFGWMAESQVLPPG